MMWRRAFSGSGAALPTWCLGGDLFLWGGLDEIEQERQLVEISISICQVGNLGVVLGVEAIV